MAGRFAARQGCGRSNLVKLHGSGTREDSPSKISAIQFNTAFMVPEKYLKEPKQLTSNSANPWDALSREVQVEIGNRDRKVRETTESPVVGQDKTQNL